MRKRIKKLIILTLVLCGLICNNINAFAKTTENPAIMPLAEAHCGRYATHDMLSRGWGSIYRTDGTNVVYMGACHQCTRCNLVFICQGEPLSSSIGYWATWQADETVNTITVLRTDNIYHTTSKTIEGMSFRY